MREQPCVEDLFPSIQNPPPGILAENREQVNISKHHHFVSKQIAKVTAAYCIWYTSSRKQVYTHENMQHYIIPLKVQREHCCVLTLLRFFSAIASLLTSTHEHHLLPTPCCSRYHRLQPGQVQSRRRTSWLEATRLADAWLQGLAFAISNGQISHLAKEIWEQKQRKNH